MNQQEAFNQVFNAIIAQGQPAMSAAGLCTYRNTLGHRCAVGMMLSDTVLDELQRTGQDGEGISSMVSILRDDNYHNETQDAVSAVRRAWAELAIGDLDHADTLYLWDDIQEAHDRAARENQHTYQGSEFVDRWIGRMRAVAEKHGLEVPDYE